jgi:hypothetical protein
MTCEERAVAEDVESQRRIDDLLEKRRVFSVDKGDDRVAKPFVAAVL